MPVKPGLSTRPVRANRWAPGMGWLLVLVLCVGVARAETPFPATASHWIGNAAVRLNITRMGAMITELRVAGSEGNWLAPSAQTGDAHRFAHYLCFDRWGAVSAAETAEGIPFHGMAGVIPWQWVETGPREVIQKVQLPIHHLIAVRKVALVDDAGVWSIRNVIENPTDITRPYNAVEHLTLSRHWVGPETTLHTNARRGFLTSASEPVPDSDFEWPFARFAGRTWDLRESVLIGVSVVASLVFPDDAEWAWVCLVNRQTNDLYGLVWRTADYPWLDLWWQAEKGKLINRSIEPGTTGLHQPMPILEKARTKLGRPVFNTLAPGAKRSLQAWVFALHLPGPPSKLRTVQVEGSDIHLIFDKTAQPVVLPMGTITPNHD